jgi:hypothetical protein
VTSPVGVGVAPGGVVLAVAEPLGHDAADLRTRARELLSGPPYQPAEQGVVARLWERALRWVAEFLDSLVFAASEVGWLGWSLVGLGVLVLGLLVWRLTRGTAIDRRVPAVVPDVGGRSAADWHAEAARHEAAGELTLALRCRYAGIVADLVETGVLDDVPGRTVRELDEALAVAAPALVGRVTEAGGRFEAVVYGGRPATEDDLRVVAAATQEQVA